MPTFKEYINNPQGKGSASIPNRELIKQNYSTEWDALCLRENGLILYHMYKGNEDYFIHYKIPSGIIDKFYYDVVIRFFPPNGNKKAVMLETNLDNYEVQFYSNDPSFVFTYCYAFNSHHLFIKDLESKMSKRALKEPAKVKNPRNDIGYVKTIYFAYLEMKRGNLFSKGRWDGVADKYSKNVWNNVVAHADDKIKDSQELAAAKRKEEKRLKNREKNMNEEFEDKATNGKSSKKPFASPNIPNFGHFKAPSPNKLGITPKTSNRGFGRFKSSN